MIELVSEILRILGGVWVSIKLLVRNVFEFSYFQSLRALDFLNRRLFRRANILLLLLAVWLVGYSPGGR